MERIRAAVVQTRSTEDIDHNLQRAAELVRGAAADGAQLIALPENVAWLRISATENVGEPLDGRIVTFFRDLAREVGAAILIGSYQEQSSDPHKVHNTSVLIDRDGQIVTSYRKVHLFDIDIPGSVSFRESAHVMPGDRAVTADVAGARVGLSVCYDLRFPELYRRLLDQGAEVLMIPAAFTLQTGKDHWEVLMRARAIENQCYVLAPGQWGHHGGIRHSYGHSMIVDPWGHVIAKCSDGEGWATAWLDPQLLAQVRRNLPCGQHRRF
jgi:predicted amidohydrolase